MTAREIAVVGAGAIGVCCARWLQRDGHAVRLLDPLAPGEGCSWGNAGVFAVDNVLPLATPAALAALPRMLVLRASPLRLPLAELVALAPWLLRFAAAARPTRVRASTQTLAALNGLALPGLRPITADRPAAELMHPTGWVMVFESERALAVERRGVAEREARGIRAHWLDADAVHRRIPTISRRVRAAVEFPDAWMCSDPGAFVGRLAADVEADGGTIERATVDRVRPGHERVAVETTDGPVTVDHCVIAAGVGSGRLAAALGEPLPLAAERGYHAMLPPSDAAPPMPVISAEHRFVTTAMAAGVRLAGTSELARAERRADPRRVQLLLEQGAALFPGLDTSSHTRWLGARSTTPDSVPVIGRSARHPAVSYACGHQHLGLTLAGITGRLIADELAGRALPLDAGPLRIERF